MLAAGAVPVSETAVVDRAALLDFLRARRLAVVATTSRAAEPQAALVGYAVTDELELVFDTSQRSRKLANVSARPRVAAVVGWEGEATVQYEGIADQPTGDELTRCKRCYFDVYPDGRARELWPDIAYVRVRPVWARFSDYGQEPPLVIELDLS